MNAQTLPDISISDDLRPLVKPGLYDLSFVDFKTAVMFLGNAPKLVMTFRIVTMGKFFGIELNRYYNVQRICGKPQRHGQFKPSSKGDFVREYMTLFTGKVSRLDRIPMSFFESVLIEGKVDSVTRSRGRDIPKELQYSVIKELRRVL